MNKKGLILNCIFMGISALALIFLACPYAVLSGYNYLEFIEYIAQNPEGTSIQEIIILASIIFTLLFALVFIGTGVVSLLVSTGTIKVKKIGKIFALVQMILSAVFVVVAAIPFVLTLVYGYPIAYTWGAMANLFVSIAVLVVAILKFIEVNKKAQE